MKQGVYFYRLYEALVVDEVKNKLLAVARS